MRVNKIVRCHSSREMSGDWSMSGVSNCRTKHVGVYKRVRWHTSRKMSGDWSIEWGEQLQDQAYESQQESEMP